MHICATTHTNRHPLTQPCITEKSRLTDIFQNSPPPPPQKKKNKNKMSQLAKVIIWHQVCFLPNACLAFFDSPLSCFVPSLLNSAPSSSPTCVTNWLGSICSLEYLKIFSPIKSDLTTVTGSQDLRLTLAWRANKCT